MRTLTLAHCDACGDDTVTVVLPGTEEIRELFLLKRGEAERHYCLKCAQKRGWPWLQSEAQKQKRKSLV